MIMHLGLPEPRRNSEITAEMHFASCKNVDLKAY